MITLNNKNSLMAASNLREHALEESKAMKRLSSGLRINSAADDAAGLAISNRLKAEGYAELQLQRNLQDGISYSQVAEGALEGVNDLLQRMRQLSIQAQNDINTTADRAALHEDFSRLRAEIDHIAKNTIVFGKYPLLGESRGNLENVATLDQVLENGVAEQLPSGLVSIAYIPKGSANLTVEIDSYAMNDDIQIFTISGKHLVGTPLSSGTWSGQGVSDAEQAKEQFLLPANGYRQDASYDDSQLLTGGTVEYDGMNISYSGDLHATSDYIEQLTIDVVTEDLIISVVGDGSFEVIATWDSIGSGAGSGEWGDEGPMKITAGKTPSSDEDFITIDKTPASSSELGLEELALDPFEKAREAMQQLDASLNKVGSHRAYHGSKINAMESISRTSSVNYENSQSSKMRIADADFASETSVLVSSQIKRSATESLFARMKESQGLVLQLLKDAGS